MTGAPGDFSPRTQGSLQEICESLEIVGKIVSVFTQTFFLEVEWGWALVWFKKFYLVCIETLWVFVFFKLKMQFLSPEILM